MSTSRVRRTVLSVPASSERMVEKARTLPVDEVFLDLEDAVAPDAKRAAREVAADALRDDRWAAGTVGLRVNGWSSGWTADDLGAVIGRGCRIDCVILPKVDTADDVARLGALLDRAESVAALEPGSVGIEVQVESARALLALEEIAVASPRVESLVFGPVDFMADLGMAPDASVTESALLVPLMRILTVARAVGLQAIDGPYVKVRDVDGFTKAAGRVAALGYDGKWVLHPDQVAAGNAAFTPTAEDYLRAVELVAAYEQATTGDHRGAVRFGDEMIDEASRRLAAAVVARGRAAGMEEQQ